MALPHVLDSYDMRSALAALAAVETLPAKTPKEPKPYLTEETR